MTACFLDTNVLIYAISTDKAGGAKKEQALTLLDRRDIGLSVQVLQEFYVQATRSSRPSPLSHDLAAGLIESWSRFKVQDMTLAVMTHALEIKARFRLSYWDSAIVAASLAMGCDTLMTEEMQHGQQFGRVTVCNPFRL